MSQDGPRWHHGAELPILTRQYLAHTPGQETSSRRGSNMQNLRSLLDGFSAKEASIATGAILAALAWTLTRLADTVGSYNTLEYRIVQQGAALAGGDQGFKVQVMLSNLSGDTTLGRVHAQLSVHGKGVKFS